MQRPRAKQDFHGIRPSGPDATPPNHTIMHADFGMQERGLGDSVLQDRVHRIEVFEANPNRFE